MYTYNGAQGWKLASKTLYANQAAGLITAAGVSTSLGVGGQHAELSEAAAELSGVSMATADELYFLIDREELRYMDLTKDLQCEVVFESGTSGGSTGAVWKAFIKGTASGAALGDAVASPDGSITFDAVGNGGTSFIKKTGRKPFNLTSGVLNADEVIVLAIELDAAGSAAADDIRLMLVRLFGTFAPYTDDAVPQTT